MYKLYLTFANGQDLACVQREYEEVHRILSPRALLQDYYAEWDPFPRTDTIARNLVYLKEWLFLFHFGGHAGQDILGLLDRKARAEGVTHLLGQCPRLKLVVLNGCATAGQVAALWEAGVPVVIATHAPVDDELAARFAIRFYQALEHGETIGQAFELAIGEVLTMRKVNVYRGKGRPANPSEPVWGIFFRDEHVSVLTEKLPVRREPPPPEHFTPNEKLLATLFDTLSATDAKVKEQHEKEKAGEYIPTDVKQDAVSRALPAPIGEHLRKLFMESSEGFNTCTLNRLAKTATIYQMAMELLFYTLVAQLWDVHMPAPPKPPVSPPPAFLRQSLRAYFSLSREAHRTFDYIPLIRQIREYFDSRQVACFVEELGAIRTLFQTDSEFAEACLYLHALRRQLLNEVITDAEVPEVCRRAENSLCAFLTPLGFLARYSLASIKEIDVRNYRHRREDTRYGHSLITMIQMSQKSDVKLYLLHQFMENKSVLLLRRDEEAHIKFRGYDDRQDQKKHPLFEGEKMGFLNLSPFVIDKNGFDPKADMTNPCFFDWYDAGRDLCFFKYVKVPDEAGLEVSAASREHPIVKEQFDAFRQLMLT